MNELAHATHDVFISYSAHDKQWADAACSVLEGARIRCWIAPRDIAPGTEWGASIISGIDGCRVMVLIFSTHANESGQVRREVERAISKGLTVLPCRVQDVRPVGAMEYALSNTHWLDAFTPPVEHQLKILASSVEALLARAPSAPGHTEHVLPPDKSPKLLKRIGIVCLLLVLLSIGVGLCFWSPRPPIAMEPKVLPAPAAETEPKVLTAPTADETADGHFQAGQRLSQEGRINEAIAEFETAIQLDPEKNLERGYKGRATAYSKQGDDTKSKAIRAAEEGIELLANPAKTASRASLDEAKRKHLEAIELDPGYAVALNEWAWLCVQTPDANDKDRHAAVERAAEACRLTGGFWKYLDTLAAAWSKVGDFDKAVNFAKLSLSKAPPGDDAATRYQLSRYEKWLEWCLPPPAP